MGSSRSHFLCRCVRLCLTTCSYSHLITCHFLMAVYLTTWSSSTIVTLSYGSFTCDRSPSGNRWFRVYFPRIAGGPLAGRFGCSSLYPCLTVVRNHALVSLGPEWGCPPLALLRPVRVSPGILLVWSPTWLAASSLFVTQVSSSNHCLSFETLLDCLSC